MSTGLEGFIAAAPWPQRTGMRLLLGLVRRPRSAALLARLPLAQQLARSLLALGHYDEPTVARALGWDAEQVIARGRELRRTEGRP